MISFIYFDVGGVVVDDFSGNNKWAEIKRELGITPDKEANFDVVWKKYAGDLCLTRDVETLVPIFAKELNLTLPTDYSLLDGFVNRFYANPDLWPILQSLEGVMPLGLLTNMYVGMFAAIERRQIMPPTRWDIVIDSSLEGLQKPDRRIFELAEAKAGIPKNHILFVDNASENIEEAKAFGMQTFLYKSGQHKLACAELTDFLAAQNLTRSPAHRAKTPRS